MEKKNINLSIATATFALGAFFVLAKMTNSGEHEH